jgi:hypothetical protein
MFKSGFPLNTQEKVRAAIHNKTLVLVVQNGDLLEYSGVIESQTKDSVILDNGDKYLKTVCEFRVR